MMEMDSLVADVLEQIISNNQHLPRRTTSASSSSAFAKFQSSYIPEVTVPAYLQRIRRYSKCSDSSLVLMLVYVDRAIERCDLVLTSLNIHRLLIVSIMLAAKFHEDLFYNNAFYAQLGGLALSELNDLEVEFLTQLEYSLHVDCSTYVKYHSYLQAYAVQRTAVISSSPSLGSSPLAHCSPRGVAVTTSVAIAAPSCENAFQFSPFGVHKRVPSMSCVAAFSPQPSPVAVRMTAVSCGVANAVLPGGLASGLTVGLGPTMAPLGPGLVGVSNGPMVPMRGGAISLGHFPMPPQPVPLHVGLAIQAMPAYPSVPLYYGVPAMPHYMADDPRACFLRPSSAPFEVSVGY